MFQGVVFFYLSLNSAGDREHISILERTNFLNSNDLSWYKQINIFLDKVKLTTSCMRTKILKWGRLQSCTFKSEYYCSILIAQMAWQDNNDLIRRERNFTSIFLRTGEAQQSNDHCDKPSTEKLWSTVKGEGECLKYEALWPGWIFNGGFLQSECLWQCLCDLSSV